MVDFNGKSGIALRRIVILSILLLYFTVPHTLEDFATGEPGKAGIPAPAISFVVSTIFSLQALGLYWLGQKKRRGLLAQAGVGLFWPLASAFAQLPSIINERPYRSGFISVAYVVGIIVTGVLLFFFSLKALLSIENK